MINLSGSVKTRLWESSRFLPVISDAGVAKVTTQRESGGSHSELHSLKMSMKVLCMKGLFVQSQVPLESVLRTGGEKGGGGLPF